MTSHSQGSLPLHQEAGAMFGELLKYTGELITPSLAGELALKLASVAQSQEHTEPEPQSPEEALTNIIAADEAVTDARAGLDRAVQIARKLFNISYGDIGEALSMTRQAAWERFSGKAKEQKAE